MKKTIIIVVALGVLFAGGGYYWWSSHSAMGEQDMAAMAERSAVVSTLVLKKETISLSQTLPGRISPYRQSQVRPQVAGIITERLFEEGVDVEKGQQLYQIDDARYKAALNSALADLKSAKANVKTVKAKAKRYEELVKAGAVSKQEYDDATAQLDQANAAIAVAQAAVDVARVNLDYTKVYAPISGRISRSFVTEGALVTANQSQHLATITQLDPVYVDMQQSGTDVLNLHSRIMGKDTVSVQLILDDQTGAIYPKKGTLKFSEVTIDETTGSIALRALMPNEDGVLLSGLFARAMLDLGESEVLLVPQRATIRNADGNLIVWIVDQNNQAQVRPITVERAYGDHWIVTSGLDAGDQVIIEGYLKIRAGALVQTAPWQEVTAKAKAKE